MKGTVTRIRENAVFVRLNYSNIIGIVFRENCADTAMPDIEKLYAIGDSVKARILKFDKSKRQLRLSLKPSDLPEEEETQVVKMMESDDEIPRALEEESESEDDEVIESDSNPRVF